MVCISLKQCRESNCTALYVSSAPGLYMTNVHMCIHTCVYPYVYEIHLLMWAAFILLLSRYNKKPVIIKTDSDNRTSP